MDENFKQYEREYLERAGATPTPGTKEWHRIEQVKAAKKTATEAGLDPWDYVVLEMIRRGDPRKWRSGF